MTNKKPKHDHANDVDKTPLPTKFILSVVVASFSLLFIPVNELSAEELSPTSEWPVFYIERGDSYMEQGQYRKAIADYKRLVGMLPKAVNARIRIAYALKQLGQKEEAYQLFKDAVSTVPDFAKYDFARRVYRNPGDPEAHYGLGLAYTAEKKTEEAVISFKNVIALSPEHADAHLQLGMAYSVLEEKELALDEYKVLKRLDELRAQKLYQLLPKFPLS